jgi:hypothetical protein
MIHQAVGISSFPDIAITAVLRLTEDKTGRNIVVEIMEAAERVKAKAASSFRLRTDIFRWNKSMDLLREVSK